MSKQVKVWDAETRTITFGNQCFYGFYIDGCDFAAIRVGGHYYGVKVTNDGEHIDASEDVTGRMGRKEARLWVVACAKRDGVKPTAVLS